MCSVCSVRNVRIGPKIAECTCLQTLSQLLELEQNEQLFPETLKPPLLNPHCKSVLVSSFKQIDKKPLVYLQQKIQTRSLHLATGDQQSALSKIFCPYHHTTTMQGAISFMLILANGSSLNFSAFVTGMSRIVWQA